MEAMGAQILGVKDLVTRGGYRPSHSVRFVCWERGRCFSWCKNVVHWARIRNDGYRVGGSRAGFWSVRAKWGDADATAASLPLSQVRPSPAEAARTIVDIGSEGTLSTMSEDNWPSTTVVRFAVDLDGNPVFRFPDSFLPAKHIALDNRSSLHVQVEQPGRQKPHCALRGRVFKADAEDTRQKLETTWERRFGKERTQDDVYYAMTVEEARQSQDIGEEEIWVAGSDYSNAAADPLRECAPRIVEDMNRKHWEDIRRICSVYAKLDAELKEASMTWVDRLGFDLRVATQSPQALLEIRIPYPREVSDERDARSLLTMMAQIAWEQERNSTMPEVQFVSNFNIS